MGNKPKYRGMPGGADTRLLTNHADTPTLHFGPGVTHTIHCPNEYTEIQQVLDVTKVTALTILDWCR
jgi:acetylornithine deacetylase